MKKYQIILADPPWAYRVWSKKGAGRSAESHYPTMSMDDIRNLPVRELADKNCILFMWVTFPTLREAFSVIDAWGFTYKTVAFAWVKQNKKTSSLFWGMPAFTTIINNIYLLLIPVGVLIGMHTTDFREYSLTFIFYLIIVHAISGVLNKIMYISESFTQIDGSVERMDEILRIPVLPEKSTAATIENYGIAFRNVSFSYEADSQVKALSHVSFFADQGKVTAIVGPSGGGKSTIASLISRFYDVTDGSIQIGGVDIRDIPLDALMDKVSFVFQDTFLFKQSILDNIRMGNPDATEEQVIAAAKAARCHEFIEQLPNGYQTVIGSTGVHLSGGERQRIAIARAIVKDAPIIVLDEATAFSDPENEYLIQKAFEKLIQNKTVVMIAHRLSTIRNADQILVMEKGCLIESGTHDELLKKDGKYAQMWSSYTESINWKIGTGKAV